MKSAQRGGGIRIKIHGRIYTPEFSGTKPYAGSDLTKNLINKKKKLKTTNRNDKNKK